MAAGLSAATSPKPVTGSSKLSPLLLLHKPAASLFPSQQSIFAPSLPKGYLHHCRSRKKARFFPVCFVLDEGKETTAVESLSSESSDDSTTKIEPISINSRAAERLARKRSERFTYLVAAVMSSFGITSMAVMAVYYRFSWQMEVNIAGAPTLLYRLSANAIH